MSVQDLPPELDETTAEPEDLTVRRLVRAIDYAEGFWLGFAKSNTPAQRRRLSALCRDLLEPLKIRVLEIELTEPITDLLPVLRERLGQESATNDAGTMTGEAHATTRPKLAIFVHGLERSIPSREAYPPLLSSFNLKRELFRQEIQHPLLLWLPDYALTALARKAPDFWAWRSGLYEFAPEQDSAEQSLDAVRGQALHITESLSEQAKRERMVMLKGLLDDYRELGNGPREQQAQADILSEIGLMHQTLGEWAEAKQPYMESLTISRNLNNYVGEALAQHNLGVIAHQLKHIEEARHLYHEALEIERRLGDQAGIAMSLHQLAILAQKQGEADTARRLYEESLEIAKKLDDMDGVADTLHQLGMLAQVQGNMEEGRQFYNESLEINKRRGDLHGVATNLGQIARLAENEGDNAEAARLYREALIIFETLGSPYAKLARLDLARVKGREDMSG